MKIVSLKWVATGMGTQAYADYAYDPITDGDISIDLDAVFLQTVGDNIRPRALDVTLTSQTQKSVNNLLVDMSIDTTVIPVYGRYRTAIREDQRYLTIVAQKSNTCNLRFYSWPFFGEHFSDNSVVVNGTILALDAKYSQTKNLQTFALAAECNAAGGTSNILCKLDLASASQSTFVTGLCVSQRNYNVGKETQIDYVLGYDNAAIPGAGVTTVAAVSKAPDIGSSAFTPPQLKWWNDGSNNYPTFPVLFFSLAKGQIFDHVFDTPLLPVYSGYRLALYSLPSNGGVAPTAGDWGLNINFDILCST